MISGASDRGLRDAIVSTSGDVTFFSEALDLLRLPEEQSGGHSVTPIGRTLSLWRQLAQAMRRIMSSYVAFHS
jgi:hypothetical protein